MTEINNIGDPHPYGNTRLKAIARAMTDRDFAWVADPIERARLIKEDELARWAREKTPPANSKIGEYFMTFQKKPFNKSPFVKPEPTPAQLAARGAVGILLFFVVIVFFTVGYMFFIQLGIGP